jgi:transcriptional regulator with XRE-family HTH domain
LVANLIPDSLTAITKLLRRFGFTVRDLAEVLGVSHTMMLQVDAGNRNLNPQLRKTLAHPLFAEIEEHESSLPDDVRSLDETEWLQAKLHQAETRLKKEKTKWEGMVKKRDGCRNIIHHTRNLDPDTKKGVDLIVDWWNWQRAKAEQFLRNRNIRAEQEQEKKVHLLEKEVEYLKMKLGISKN